jgi:hypothetical protein
MEGVRGGLEGSVPVGGAPVPGGLVAFEPVLRVFVARRVSTVLAPSRELLCCVPVVPLQNNITTKHTHPIGNQRDENSQ